MYTISDDNKEFLTNAVLDVYDYIRERDGLWYEAPAVDEKDTYELTELLRECLVILDDMNNYKGKLKMNDITKTKSISDTQVKLPAVAACEPVAEVVEADTKKVEATPKVANDDKVEPEDIIA